MSTDRNTNRPLKPTLASNRNTRTPLTPRVAANATTSTKPTAPKPTPTIRSEPATPRTKGAVTPVNGITANGNVTPRSSARNSRVESATSSPSQGGDTPNSLRPRSALVGVRTGNAGGLGISSGEQNRTGENRQKSLISDNGAAAAGRSKPPLIRSPGSINEAPRPPAQDVDNRFFHASDAPKQQEPVPQKPEPKKPAAFFYADGQQEAQASQVPPSASPVLSAISEQRSAGPWVRADSVSNASKSPPILSPSLSAISSTSPFFVSGPAPRSPSPSKENIHLSYRKGASQIFGTRPTPPLRSTASSTEIPPIVERRGSNDPAVSNVSRHHKSPSLSSIDSAQSLQSRRRSFTPLEGEPSSSPLAHEIKAATIPRIAKPLNDLPTIDTSLESPGIIPPSETALSPTKNVGDLAADARRERKVLDLEISNSSLLAINASLEREVRRQKAELKRFRRLSRAGRFSSAPSEGSARPSDGLSTVGEEDEDEDGENMFGPASGLSELYDDMSDEDDESLNSSDEPLSPAAESQKENDRLAKDEKRLQVDLQKHKELLVQSQAMNQSLKRCMYATEEMIREGKKALDYHVRVSDVKLGGRVLSSHDDEDISHEIEVEDDHNHEDPTEPAKGFLDVWTGLGRPSFEGSEGGDRDSGVEVDRPLHTSLPPGYKSNRVSDSGRPPGEIGSGIMNPARSTPTGPSLS